MNDKEKTREQVEKLEIKKYGHKLEPIKCCVCHQTGGTLVKIDKNKYRHQKCT